MPGPKKFRLNKNFQTMNFGTKNKIGNQYSIYLKMMFSKSKGYSIIPVVGTLTRNTSCCVGRYPGLEIRSTSDK